MSHDKRFGGNRMRRLAVRTDSMREADFARRPPKIPDGRADASDRLSVSTVAGLGIRGPNA